MLKSILVVVASVVIFSGCTSTLVPPSQKEGAFPQVTATRLSGEKIILPDALKGSPAILLVGYQQRTQFDIDRWLLGLLDAGIKAQIIEIPTIEGMIPGALSEVIDNGMRSGIPKEDWYSVATVYEDADKIIKAIGNERPQSAHVVLLNSAGEIIWTYYNGYSPRVVRELRDKVNSLG
jgi:hypothetical protein